MKKLSLLPVLFLVLLLMQPASAVETEVKKNSVISNLGLYGGQPEDIAMEHGTDNAYITNFAASGFFFTNDGGTTWEGLPSDTNYGVGKSVEVDQETGDVYALVGDSLLMSTNAGVDFMDITTDTGTSNFDRAMVIGHGLLLIALNDGSVLIGENMGDSYSTTTIENESNIWDLAASPTTDTFFAIAENDGEETTLYQSTDGGTTWNDMEVHDNGVASGGRFFTIGVDPLDGEHLILSSNVDGNFIYQSFDEGASWEALSNVGLSNYVAWDGEGTMFLGNQYTDDAAAETISWTKMNSSTPLSSSGFDILIVDRANPETLYTGTGLGIAKSTDRGQNWTDIVDGIEAVKIYTFSQAEDKDIAWIGANGGLGRSSNFTAEDPDWTYPILPDQDTAHWKCLWVKADDPDVVIAAGGNVIYKTENGTEETPTWTETTTPVLGAGQCKEIVANPEDYTLYIDIMDDDLAGDDDAVILSSDDLGDTWTDLEITDSIPATCITLTADEELFAGIGGDAETRGIYMMDTDGVWSKPSTDLDDYEVTDIVADPTVADTIYATTQSSTSGGLYKSEDGGENWTQVTDGLSSLINYTTLAIQASTTPDTIYVAGQKDDLNAGVYKSNDAGVSWNLLYTGLKQESIYTLFFDGLITGNDRGLFEIKSRPSLKITLKKAKVNKGKKAQLTLTLKDKVTDKKLKKKKLKIYRKVGKKNWMLYKTVKTNKKGKKILKVKINKATRFKAKWNPKGNFAEEYSNVTSATKRVRLKK